jgi:hypothetical protein
MKLRNLFASLALVTGLALSSAQATILVSDDFESYADTAAMQAVWGAAGVGTLDTAVGNPGQSMRQNGGVQNQQTFSPTTPTTSDRVVFSVDIYDDGTSANKRMTAGLRGGAASNIFEMGMYNGPSHYAVRAVLPGPSWLAFTGLVNDAGNPIANSPVAGWHTYRLELDGATATFTLDLNGDGNINGTVVVPVVFNGAAPLNTVRLGLGLSSAGGGANFDNVSLAVVPEPASMALVGLMGLGLACVRTRR